VANAWSPANTDHSQVVGNCSSCHNGITARGKGAGHLQTTDECDVCHSVVAWTPAAFDHALVLSSACAGCHNGVSATGKPNGHFVTSRECVDCHTTASWLPVLYRHDSINYPGDHGPGVGCQGCHSANSESVSWSNAAYRPDCAGCHANDFEPGEHTKVANPRTSYLVSDLRDCSGACHVYADNSLTVITDIRSSEHRPRDGDWD
jgi:hypothetical protein